MRGATQLQGDIIAILDGSGNAVVQYSYDAWGKLLSTTTGPNCNVAAALGVHNPLRYRGYVYDHETQLYYLQSRYYDPELGRFLNADALATTGQGILGNNMFTYCLNNPVAFEDENGYSLRPSTTRVSDIAGPGAAHHGTTSSDDWTGHDGNNHRTSGTPNAIANADVDVVYRAEKFTFYKGKLVIRHTSEFLTSWSICGIIFLNHSGDHSSDITKERLLKHEYGHTLQEQDMGMPQYIVALFIPSATYNLVSRKNPVLDANYYNMPWEYDTDMRGGVVRDHASWAGGLSFIYSLFWR